MKKCLALMITSLSFLMPKAVADESVDFTQQNIGSERMEPTTTQTGSEVSFRGDWIGPTKIDKRKFRHQHVNFYNLELQGEQAIYYNAKHKEGLLLSLGVSHTYFHWKQNPYFRCDNFNLLSLSVTGFSARINNWLFQAYATANWQYDYQRVDEYSNYDFMLWSRYAYCPNVINIHAGFLLQTGMKIDRICPILGFDWRFADKWKLNAIFPVNMSLEYEVNEQWRAALAARIFDVRYRVGKHERLKEALLEYYNYGIEFAATYTKGTLLANIHAGTTLGGEFKISNRQHRRKKHFEMGLAPYVGGEAALKF